MPAARPPRLRPRRMSAPPPRAAPPRLPPCRPLSLSLEALDLSPTSPTQALASLRFLVLSYLADLERRISLCGETSTALDMLHSIRADVRSHLPDLHLPDFVTSIDFSRPLSYVPTLSARLKSLHAHLATELPAFSDFEFRKPSFDFEFSRPSFDFEFRKPSFDFAPSFDLTTPPVLREMFDVFRADLGRFPSAEDVLVRADFGRRLINYSDLPIDWRNNPWVVTGYRFIPLSSWPRLVLSLFQLHNETLNIHTHFLPMVMWGLAFYGFETGPLPRWLHPLRPTDMNTTNARPPLPLDESLFTVFALLCLASSSLWHTMAGCAHKGAMETCARVDYVGIGWLIAVSIGTIVHHGYACVVPELAHVGGEKISTLLQPVLLHSGAGIGGVAGVEALGVFARLKHALAGTVPMASFLFPFTAPLYVVARLLEQAVLAPLTPLASSFVTPLASTFNSPWTSLTASLPSLAALESLTVALMSSAASWPAYHPVGAGCLLLCAAAGVSGNVLPFCDWFNRVENRLWRLAALAPLAGIVWLQGWDVMWSFVGPERWLGGSGGWVGWASDMCGGGSHGIWHIFIVLAIRAHRDGIREMRRVAGEAGCAIGVPRGPGAY
ncbi:hypothetical protein K438DRAFT_1822649 [Mycena galopus ATCC 62051]|nr:hypothetical protein K438DRAFT_1822649 [Mycena galopus ATCC 62051]